MVVLKTRRELALMRDACRISAEALQIAGEAVKPGVTTAEIDRIAYSYIVKQGATPNFLHLYGFPATACISINDEVIHGIPSKERVIREGDIGSAVQRYCEERGYGVVREYTGHGVGAKLHEDPSVPNFGTPGRGVRLLPGMTLAIEPMINQGTAQIKSMPDGWTVKTADGKLSAHFEHTVAITADGPQILTQV